MRLISAKQPADLHNNSTLTPHVLFMPFNYIWESQGFYVKFWGEISYDDIEAKNQCFTSDPRSDECRYRIFDASEVEFSDLSKSDIKKMASHDIGMSSYLRNFSVIMISSNPEVQAVFDLYISTCLRSKLTWRFHVCKSLEEGREWLRQLEEKRQKTTLEATHRQLTSQ